MECKGKSRPKPGAKRASGALTRGLTIPRMPGGGDWGVGKVTAGITDSWRLRVHIDAAF